MRGSKEGVGGWGSGGSAPPPPEFAKLKIADISGNEKKSYFSYLCISTVIRQGWTSHGKMFWIRACYSPIPTKLRLKQECETNFRSYILWLVSGMCTHEFLCNPFCDLGAIRQMIH